LLTWKLQNVYTRAGSTAEDVAVTTHHFTSADDWPSSAWTAVENAIKTACALPGSSVRAIGVKHAEMRWYRAEGLPKHWEHNWGDAHRVTAVTGYVDGASAMLPPQIALSVTLKTTVRRSWGRFYLPTIGIAGNLAGRPTSAVVDSTAVAWRDAFNACQAAGLSPGVLGSYETGTIIPTVKERHPRFLGLRVVQVDNVFDVIRRRRFDITTQRAAHSVNQP
jgi:hypothetical protein